LFSEERNSPQYHPTFTVSVKQPSLIGSQASAHVWVDALSCRMDPAWLPEGGFPVLGLVDLSDNLIEIEDAITVFLAVPPLDKVVLWGNPLATFAPREVGAQVPFVGSQQAFLLLQRPPPPTKPRLNQLYADPVVLDEELPPKPMPFQVCTYIRLWVLG
jgi:hypothetical protein